MSELGNAPSPRGQAWRAAALIAGAALFGGAVALAADPPPADARAPIPDAPAQIKAEGVIRDVFGKYATAPAADRSAIAAKMLEQAIAPQNDPTNRYVLLKDAADLAAGVGDASLAMKAAALMSQSFAIDAGELKLQLLRKAGLAATTPNAAKAVATHAYAAANDASTAGDYESAAKFIAVAEAAARAAKSVDLLSAVQARANEIRAVQQESARGKAAQAKLAKNPDDAEANYA